MSRIRICRITEKEVGRLGALLLVAETRSAMDRAFVRVLVRISDHKPVEGI